MASVVVVVDNKNMERPGEASKARYLKRIRDLDLEDLAFRQELAGVLGLKNVSHEDLSRHHCVDWLKAHEAHFSRASTLETVDLTGIPQKSIMGTVNYRTLEQLGIPDCGTSQASNGFSQDQIGNSCTTKVGRKTS